MADSQHDSLDSDRRLKYLMLLALLAALVYLLNRWIIIPQAGSSPFFRDHMGDILALPVYLPLSFYLAVRLEVIPRYFQLTLGHVLGAAVLFSIIFEGLVPLVDASSTSDVWDIVAYFGGGLLVYFIGRIGLVQSVSTEVSYKVL